jgi:hypothetical protein
MHGNIILQKKKKLIKVVIGNHVESTKNIIKMNT